MEVGFILSLWPSFLSAAKNLVLMAFRSDGFAVGRVPSVDVTITSSFGRRSVAQSGSGWSGFGLWSYCKASISSVGGVCFLDQTPKLTAVYHIHFIFGMYIHNIQYIALYLSLYAVFFEPYNFYPSNWKFLCSAEASYGTDLVDVEASIQVTWFRITC